MTGGGAGEEGITASDPFDEAEAPLPATKAASKAKRKRSRGSFLAELPVLVLVALVVAVLIKSFLVQAFYIPSGSMVPTLLVNDRVMVNKLAYTFGEPQQGDIVVFDSPYNDDEPRESLWEAALRHVAEAFGRGAVADDFIKRVVAVEGDTVEIRQNQVLVNGEPIDEPYLRSGATMPDEELVIVPPGHVFVMGDNRSHSQDSRRFGPVAVDDIVGRAFVRIWPPSRWGGL